MITPIRKRSAIAKYEEQLIFVAIIESDCFYQIGYCPD